MPLGWGDSLKAALHKWCNLSLSDMLDLNCGVTGFQLTGDRTTAVVEITPSSGERFFLLLTTSPHTADLSVEDLNE